MGVTKWCEKKSSLIKQNSDLKKKIPDVRKKWKANVLNLDLGQKMANSHKASRARPQEVNSFPGTTSRCAKESSLSWLESELKNKSVKYEKSEEITFKITVIYFLIACLCHWR